jgi:hypothetical protein
MHGSKAFLEQLACKLLIQVELANKKSESRTDQNIIISQLIRRKLTNEEKKSLCGNFGIKCYEDILEGTRIKVNSKIFHSKNYNRKRNSDSFTILFENNGKNVYGEVLYFFEYKNKVYAGINVFLNLENVIMPAEIKGFFYESFKNLFNKFYSLIDTDMKKCRYDIITVEQIKYKCINKFLDTQSCSYAIFVI